MKVIDLLNKIANGEEVPKKIKVYDDSFTYIDKWEQYTSDNTDKPLLYIISAFNYSGLNDEVETIEEEPRNIEVCGSLFTRSEYNRLAGIEEDKKIEYIYHCCMEPSSKETKFLIQNINDLSDKINEIIDYINGSDKE